MSASDTLTRPLLRENPVTFHVLGICSALAITNSLNSALIMSLALTCVLVLSNASISLIRKHLPGSVRIIIQITVIASAVTIVDELLSAFLPDVARTLSVYISLIVTNCIVLGRAEACAMSQPVRKAVLDAVGNGLGFSLVLISVAVIRELFGSGSLLGYQILELVSNGGWYQPNEMMLLPPSAFFIVAGLVWLNRTWYKEQVEKPDFKPASVEVDEIYSS